jgi:negative regulator of genetic competence, sporulation and motility
MRYLLLFSLLCIIMTHQSCKDLNLNLFSASQKAKNLALKEKQDSLRIADSIRIVQEELLELENTKLDSVRKENEKLKIRNSENRYRIVVGSFTSAQNALALAESYKSKGFAAELINAHDDGTVYVSVESYDNKSRAMERLREIKLSIEPRAWLYSAE